ncbi:ras-related protein Rab-3 [Nephila pilipes]|uniref:Ras-related protein Rab-3 n=1 Tax=Nephila pilipes TaxID=299642 RepID=A0A8X6T8P8_NEPPI|nr:ras-related protein Rab-3 [Nephila pilipes]
MATPPYTSKQQKYLLSVSVNRIVHFWCSFGNTVGWFRFYRLTHFWGQSFIKNLRWLANRNRKMHPIRTLTIFGIDFKVKTVFRQDKRVKLQIWDTAGQERYRTITTAYYRGAMGFILMYDVTNEESFNSVQDWVTQIKTYSWDNAQVVLVGNKCDMEDERVVSTERGRQLAEQLGLVFFETSAKENINVKSVFERLVDIICDKMSESLDSDPNLVNASKGTRLTENPAPPTAGCQC